jgi:small subunit ribosomal protein S2
MNTENKEQKKFEAQISIDDILENQVNIGRSQKMLYKGLEHKVLFKKNGIVILNPEFIAKEMKEASEEVYKFAKQGKKILFIDINHSTSSIVREAAESAGEYHCTKQWRAGSITNTYTVFRLTAKLEEMKKKLENEGDSMRKKDAIRLGKRIEKYNQTLGGIGEIKGRPDLVITIANKENYLAIKECLAVNVKTIIVCDTDSSVDQYRRTRHGKMSAGNVIQINGNMHGRKSINFLFKSLGEAALSGRRDKLKTSTGVDLSKILERKKNFKEKNKDFKPKNNTQVK